jgi:ribosomal protein L7/L12
MVKCPSCGQVNPAGISLCKNCGADLPQQEIKEETPAPATGLDEELLTLLRAGKKIEAIKLYRVQTRAGLKEAKDAVESLAAEHHIIARGAGCASVLFVLAAAAIAGCRRLLAG